MYHEAIFVIDCNVLNIGICWRSGNPVVGQERNAPLGLWREILTRAGCNFVSLQYGETAADIEAARIAYGADIFVDEEVDPLTNAEDWFAQVAAMDLVISVDNSTIQVSGAQGIPTYTLLSYAPEWSFGLAGDTHDWHPSMRVFRQSQPGRWDGVFEQLAEAFGRLLDTR